MRSSRPLVLSLSFACLVLACSHIDEPPVYGSWKALGPLPAQGLERSCAVALDDGRVLVMGGSNTASTWFYEPSGDAWSPGPPMNSPHVLSSCARLADGRVAVFGDGYQRSTGTGTGGSQMDLFDPTTATWTTERHVLRTPPGRMVVTLADGRVVMAGGTTESSSGERIASDLAEMFDPATRTWTDLSPLPRPKGAGSSIFALPGNRVLVARGNEADILDVDAAKWSAGPVPPIDVYGPGMTTRDGKLGVACSVLGAAVAFDTNAMEWRPFNELNEKYRIVPKCPAGLVALSDGRLLAMELDPTIVSSDLSFVRAAHLPTQSLESAPHPAVALRDGRVVVLGLDGEAPSGALAPKIAAVFTP